MESTTGTRSACFGHGDCLRCQSAGASAAGEKTYLLLGPHNANARESVVRALTAANTPFLAWENVLALPTMRPRVSGLVATFLEHLPESITQDVKGVFFSGDLADPGRALAAFVHAEPLAALIARTEHDWVRDALDDGWLFSLFHPIVHADTGQVYAYEALIRARNPETGQIIGAGPIIDASVKLNLEHVLDQRARQSAIRCAAALNLPQMRTFINFMPNTIYDPEVCLRTTMEAAQESGVEMSSLVFEVVETERIPDMNRLKKILDYYRSRGVGTAVDDMGAGFFQSAISDGPSSRLRQAGPRPGHPGRTQRRNPAEFGPDRSAGASARHPGHCRGDRDREPDVDVPGGGGRLHAGFPVRTPRQSPRNDAPAPATDVGGGLKDVILCLIRCRR